MGLVFGTFFATMTGMDNSELFIDDELKTEPNEETILSVAEDPEPDKTDAAYNNNTRRWFHMISISLFGLVYGLSSLTWQTVLFPLAIVTLVCIGFDLLRLHVPYLNWLIQNTFSFLLRKHEFHSLSGISWFLLSAIICIVVFPKIATMLGFLYLAFGDPVASYVGIRWGKKGVGNKTWIGSLGFFVVCLAIGFPWFVVSMSCEMALVMAGIPALASAIVERNLKEMDDNLAIPITVSMLVTFLMAIFL